MGSNDKFKTAKMAREAVDMTMDGMQDKKCRKPKKKERQKGKKVIREDFSERQLEEFEQLKKFVKKYGPKYLKDDK